MPSKKIEAASSDETIFAQSKQVWESNLKLFPHSKLHYPDENLVRIFSGRYIPVPQPPAKVMDHGFGHANNLMFLLNKGYDCYGCEISAHLVEEGKKLAAVLNKTMDLRTVEGARFPFDSNFFDAVVSWNVLHYQGTKQGVMENIEEFHRVLKPGGTLVLSTVSLDSFFADRCRPVGNGSYLIEKENPHDNRKGITFYIAQSGDELAELFSSFTEVRVGSAAFNLFDHAERNAWHLIYAVK